MPPLILMPGSKRGGRWTPSENERQVEERVTFQRILWLAYFIVFLTLTIYSSVQVKNTNIDE